MKNKTNQYLNTEQQYICVSRPRRFGKSMALKMLAAYYSRGCDSADLFAGLQIEREETYRQHLNQYDVIWLNMQQFLIEAAPGKVTEYLTEEVMRELKKEYGELLDCQDRGLAVALREIFVETDRQFIFLIDEWDCVMREKQGSAIMPKQYLDFLRNLLKDQPYVALAYMTGILPVRKYGSHSALNMFTEYSMTDPGDLAEYFGFTENEVKVLCAKYEMSFEETKAWYDGYRLVTHTKDGDLCRYMYNPKSVVEAMLRHKFGTYWNRTETYEALKIYIQMDMDGLKDAVVRMLAREEIQINTGTFENDMTTFASKDDVLTLLVHLGYLTYDSREEAVAIPNKEVSQEYVNAISTMDWHEVIRSVEASRKLLESLWEMDSKAVAEGIDRAHKEISILKYNLISRKNYTQIDCMIV